jgi:hypothetical protein
VGNSLRDGYRVLSDGPTLHLSCFASCDSILLLAIADDALGLVILAVFYP